MPDFLPKLCCLYTAVTVYGPTRFLPRRGRSRFIYNPGNQGHWCSLRARTLWEALRESQGRASSQVQEVAWLVNWVRRLPDEVQMAQCRGEVTGSKVTFVLYKSI